MSLIHVGARLPWRRELGDARMICLSVLRGGKRNGAMDAIRFNGKGQVTMH
jgi:hypothetical protein